MSLFTQVFISFHLIQLPKHLLFLTMLNTMLGSWIKDEKETIPDLKEIYSENQTHTINSNT